jgi:hypothetical protein
MKKPARLTAGRNAKTLAARKRRFDHPVMFIHFPKF